MAIRSYINVLGEEAVALLAEYLELDPENGSSSCLLGWGRQQMRILMITTFLTSARTKVYKSRMSHVVGDGANVRLSNATEVRRPGSDGVINVL
jgi:hypothetical protein